MKRVLIIDDEDRQEEIENFIRIAKRSGLSIECEQFNVGSTFLPEVLTDNFIDLDKVKTEYESRFGKRTFHLICYDYQLGPGTVTGVDVLAALKPFTPKSRYLYYSSLLNEIIRQILNSYRGGEITFEKAKTNLIALVRSRVEDFVDRNNFAMRALDILRDREETLDDIFEYEMTIRFPNFRTDFFDGLELYELSQLLNNRDGKGIKLKREIVEQYISYIIKLQDNE